MPRTLVELIVSFNRQGNLSLRKLSNFKKALSFSNYGRENDFYNSLCFIFNEASKQKNLVNKKFWLTKNFG